MDGSKSKEIERKEELESQKISEPLILPFFISWFVPWFVPQTHSTSPKAITGIQCVQLWESKVEGHEPVDAIVTARCEIIHINLGSSQQPSLALSDVECCS
jgi:hypothetical protein